jgi:hypothetical protein
MVKRISLFYVFAIVVLSACGGISTEMGGQQPPVSLTVGETEASLALTSDVDHSPMFQTGQTRIVLKNAALTLVVNDAAAVINEIGTLADSSGGWVVTSNSSKIATASGTEVTQGTITIRVPAERFSEALSQIKSVAISVESENVTGQDVTQDYVDLSSQLGNLKAAESQLQAIMDGARNTEDVLSIYNELVRVRGEIETTQGRIRYYDEAAAYSSINVNLIPQAIETPIQIAGWSPGRTAENALAALINVLRLAADLVITLAILVLPLLLIFGVPGWLIYRMLARRGIIAVWATPKPAITFSRDASTEE